MREHHLVGVPALAHLRHDVHPLLERQDHVDAEPVHPEVGAGGDELLEVADVGAVAGVADDHPAQVDALFFEDALLLEPAAQPGVGVRGDRHPGALVRLGDRAQHPLDAGGDAGFVGGALEDAGLDAGVGDALLRCRGRTCRS